MPAFRITSYEWLNRSIWDNPYHKPNRIWSFGQSDVACEQLNCYANCTSCCRRYRGIWFCSLICSGHLPPSIRYLVRRWHVDGFACVRWSDSFVSFLSLRRFQTEKSDILLPWAFVGLIIFTTHVASEARIGHFSLVNVFEVALQMGSVAKWFSTQFTNERRIVVHFGVFVEGRQLSKCLIAVGAFVWFWFDFHNLGFAGSVYVSSDSAELKKISNCKAIEEINWWQMWPNLSLISLVWAEWSWSRWHCSSTALSNVSRHLSHPNATVWLLIVFCCSCTTYASAISSHSSGCNDSMS